MIRNYLKLAIRNLVRRKGYTLINIGGLALGISVCLIIFIVIQFELSFDDYHSKKDRIYRVLTEYHHPNTEVFYGSASAYALPEGIKNSIPQVEKVAAIYAENNTQIAVLNKNGEPAKQFKEKEGVFISEPSLFDVFDFKWLAGTPSTLKELNTVVLSKEIAEKYFGSWEDAMGGTVQWNNKEILKVTGVLAEIPMNTDLQIKLLVSYGTGYTSQFLNSDNWDGTDGSFGCFVLLQNNVSLSSINDQLKALSVQNKVTDIEDTHVLQSLGQIHFDTESGNFSGKSISPKMINVLWIVAGFILLIACVNFINLSTAQTVDRSKEIGIRKVLGGNKLQLKAQFLSETFMIVILAVILALLVSFVSLKWVGTLIDLPLSFGMVNWMEIGLFLVLIAVTVTFLAGFYPSLVLSRFNPINALKSKVGTVSSGGISLRRGLVVFQFIIAQTLIIGTIIVVQQMDYFMSQPLGFSKDAVVNVSIPTDSISIEKIDYLRNALTAISGVESASFSSSTPMEIGNSWGKFTFDNASEENEFYSIRKRIDPEFLNTYKLELAAGRNLIESDSILEFIINERLAKKLGINDPADALNKKVDLGDANGLVVGVVKDFHSVSLKDGIPGVFMFAQKTRYGMVGIKINSNRAMASIKAIETLWNNTFPDYVFEYEFLDDKIAAYYEGEKRLSRMYKLSATIAIFLSCLGLYGLASFMVMKRLKEAGIRKVLGATRNNIVILFSKEFILLISIAFLIAAPIAGYFMGQWLENYEFHIKITWVVFLVGGLSTMIIALTTVGYQAIKAALANPVKSLRTE
jgi:predicted permease